MSGTARTRRHRWRSRAAGVVPFLVTAVGLTMLAKGGNAGAAWCLIVVGLALWTGRRD